MARMHIVEILMLGSFLSVYDIVQATEDGCHLLARSDCGDLQDFVGCLHRYCDKGSYTPSGNNDGLEGLDDASDFRKQCNEASALNSTCPVNCAFSNCEWGHQEAFGVMLWVVFVITLLVALHAILRGNPRDPRDWRCTNPALVLNASHQRFFGALMIVPCLLILAMVCSQQMPDSTFEIMALIFVCPCLCGVILCRGLTPLQQDQQNAAAAAAAVTTSNGEQYTQLTSMEDTANIEEDLAPIGITVEGAVPITVVAGGPGLRSTVAGAEVATVQQSGSVGGEAVQGLQEAAVSGEQASMHMLTAELERLKGLAAQQEAMLGEQKVALKAAAEEREEQLVEMRGMARELEALLGGSSVVDEN